MSLKKWGRGLVRVTLAMTAVLGWTLKAQALPTLSTLVALSKDRTAVLLSGEINELDNGKSLINIFNQLPESVKILQIESLGGRLDIAMELAAIIKSRGMDTYTYLQCHSACTFVFMGGEKRITAWHTDFVFHKIRFLVNGSHTPGVEEAYWQGRATQFYLDHGMSKEFAYRIENKGSISVQGKEVDRLGVANDSRNMFEESEFLNLSFSDGEILYPESLGLQRPLEARLNF